MRTIPTLTALAVALSSAALSACASGDEGARFDGEIHDDETLVGFDTLDPNSCFITGCEDGDFCTDDFCIDNGARCIHVARNAFEACQTDFHCDDDNPCTIDKCGNDLECSLQRCTHEFIDGCRQCRTSETGGAMPPEFNECDDGNPCTVETCGEDGVCLSAIADPACDPKCFWPQALPVDALQYNYAYDGLTILGSAGPNLGLHCAEGACACDADLGIRGESGWGFPLRPSTSEPGPLMCDVEVCDVQGATCTPLVAGASYVLWGHFVTSIGFAAPAPPPPEDAGAQADVVLPPTVTALEVAGYCLSTRGDHLPGAYEGELVVGPDTARFELSVSQSLVGTLSDCEGCTALGLEAVAAMGIDANDASAVTASFRLGPNRVRGVLHAAKSTLSGRVVDEANGAELGTLQLTRVR